MIVRFNKPFNVLTQFSPDDTRETLAMYIPLKLIYPAGRLDRDSEGLLLLTDNGRLQHLISHPKHKLPKTYWVQVEGQPSDTTIKMLSRGVNLKDGLTAPATVNRISPPPVWERDPPIRHRAQIPTSWLQIEITEGRNRQVRRMTAAVGHPTLRLIRTRIGPWSLENLAPGEYIQSELNFDQLPTKWRKILQSKPIERRIPEKKRQKRQ